MNELELLQNKEMKWVFLEKNYLAKRYRMSEEDFNERVIKLHRLHPKLDILMCETLLRTPEEKLNELYEKYKDKYPVEKANETEQVLESFIKEDGTIVPVITIEHFETDPHKDKPPFNPINLTIEN